MAEEPTIFMTYLDVEAMLKREKEKASEVSSSLELRPPYSAEVASKPYPTEYIVSMFRKFDETGFTLPQLHGFSCL